jgi:hypothetical protein
MPNNSFLYGIMNDFYLKDFVNEVQIINSYLSFSLSLQEFTQLNI